MSENRRGVDSHCSFIIIIIVVHVRISVLNDIFVQLGSCYFSLCYVKFLKEEWMNEKFGRQNASVYLMHILIKLDLVNTDDHSVRIIRVICQIVINLVWSDVVNVVAATETLTTFATSSVSTNSHCSTSRTVHDFAWSCSVKRQCLTSVWPTGRSHSTQSASGTTCWLRTGAPTTATRTGSETSPTSSAESTHTD